LAACQKPQPQFHGVNLSGAPYGQDFTLRNPQGRELRLADFRGRAVLLFFGFTQCPDICPTALSRAVAVRQLLGAQAQRLQVLFMTIDPERDSPELLQAYTQAFDPSFMGLYSDAAGTARTARDFKVFYSKVPTGSSYTMDHSTLSYLFDPQGRLRVAIPHAATAAQVADDVRALLAD
jgi:protein SCO1/2